MTTRTKLTREQMADAMRVAVLDLLDEICVADGFDTTARDAGRRSLDKAMKELLSPSARGVNWALLENCTVEDVRAVTREALRGDVLRALAPMRPS